MKKMNHSYEYSSRAKSLLNFIWNPQNKSVKNVSYDDPWSNLQSELLNPSCLPVDKHDVALCLLADVVFDPTHAEESINQTLDACGPEACLTASSIILSDLAVDSDSNLLPSFPWLLRTIRRLFLHTNPPDPCQYFSWAKENSMQTDFMIQSLIRLPFLISNACLIQNVKLPSWAVRNIYFTRLLQTSLSQTHFSILLSRLLQIGATDSVANAISFDSIDWTQISSQRDQLKLMEAMLVRHLKKSFEKFHTTSFSDFKSKQHNHWKPFAEAEILPFVMTHFLPPLLHSTKSTPLYTDSLPQQLAQTILYGKKLQEFIKYPKSDQIIAHTLALLLHNCGNLIESDNDTDDEDDINANESKNCHQMKNNTPKDHDSDSIAKSVLYKVVQSFSDSWSSRSWVQRIDAVRQGRITNFLISALPLLPWTKSQSSSSPVFITLIQGVSSRLESSLLSIRIDGMKIAKLLAEILGGDVHFEELEDYNEDQHWKKEDTMPSRTESIPNEYVSDQLQRREKSSRILCRRPNIDPNAEYVSSDSEQESCNYTDDNDSIHWEDELIPLTGLDDTEEDLRPTPIPIYLRECLELLQTPESHALAYSRHETALQYLPIVLQNNPLDLIDVTVPLVQQLFRMEDKFGIEGFHEMVRSNTVALTVQDAVAVGDYVLDYIFDDVSLHTRMLGLYTLETSAQILSGAKAIPSMAQTIQEPESEREKVAGNRRLVSNPRSINTASTSKTRRWGRLQHPNHRVTVSNKFSSIAPRWFYTMIRNFTNRKDDIKLWGGANGARLLAQMLVTLATFLESCTGTATSYLTRDLLYFSWSFRTSEDATLRSAVLVALASSVANRMQENDDPSILFPTMDMNIPEFLAETIQSDPDDTCRQLANEISKTALQFLNNHSNELYLP
jgi:hypothetical protein